MSEKQPPNDDCESCGAKAGSWCDPTCAEAPPPRSDDDAVAIARDYIDRNRNDGHRANVLARAVIEQSEQIAELKRALGEALDGWRTGLGYEPSRSRWERGVPDDGYRDRLLARIAELRKLVES